MLPFLLRFARKKILALLIFAASAGCAYADQKIALLIGNTNYISTARLPNAISDVELIEKTLKTAGFEYIKKVENVDRSAMLDALREFEDKAVGSEIAVVYFSGHGIEVNGENFLIPIDAKLLAERDVADETIGLSRFLDAVDGASKLKLVVLDACRNNPFDVKMLRRKQNRAVNRGLARVEPETSNLVIAFAAKAGTLASDGDGTNSPFAKALSKHLLRPGLDIRLALGAVRDDVLSETNGQQEPYAYGSVGGGLVSISPPATMSHSGSSDDIERELELRLWDAADRSSSVAAYDAYLERFPNGIFSKLAKLNRETLILTSNETKTATISTDASKVIHKSSSVNFNEENLNLTSSQRTLIEKILLEKKTSPGPVDGIFTDETREAIRSFQYEEGYVPSGFLDASQVGKLIGSEFEGSAKPGGIAMSMIEPPAGADPRLTKISVALRGMAFNYSVMDGRVVVAVVYPLGAELKFAKAIASDAGGKLVYIRSEADNRAIFEMIKDDPRFWWKDSASNSFSGPWIGYWQQPGSRSPKTGWVWTSGAKSGYKNWDAESGQPRDSDGFGAATFGGNLKDGEPSAFWRSISAAKQRAPGFVFEVQ